jgi:hypothetical protein
MYNYLSSNSNLIYDATVSDIKEPTQLNSLSY